MASTLIYNVKMFGAPTNVGGICNNLLSAHWWQCALPTEAAFNIVTFIRQRVQTI